MDDISYQDFLHGRLKLRHLVVALTIADEGSALGAADRLQISQPAVSRIITELEKILATPLFERTPQGMRPTQYAGPFLEHARAALSHTQQAAHLLRDLSAGVAGRIKVGIHVAGANLLLPRAIIGLRTARPNLTVTVIEGSPNELVTRLAQGDIDLLITRSTTLHNDMEAHGEKITFEVLYSEALPLISSSTHWAAQREALTLSELLGEAWVVPTPGTALREEYERQFSAVQLPFPTHRTEANSMQIIRTLVEEGGYVASAPQTVADAMPGISVLNVMGHHLSSTTGVAWIRDRPTNPAAKEFLVHLKKARETLT